MESLHGSATAHWDHEPRRIPLTRPSGTLSPTGGEGWGEGVRFMESFNLQHWTRIGAMNRLAEVGRVTPCAPSFALKEGVVAAVGAQRTARPTLRFMVCLAFIRAALATR